MLDVSQALVIHVRGRTIWPQVLAEIRGRLGQMQDVEERVTLIYGMKQSCDV